MSAIATDAPLALIELKPNGRMAVTQYADKKDLAEAAVRQAWSHFFSPRDYIDWLNEVATSITAQVTENLEVMKDMMDDVEVPTLTPTPTTDRKGPHRIINTCNFSGDYPNETFLNLPTMTYEHAEKVSEAINDGFNGPGYPHPRWWLTVPATYELKPGFEP